MFLVMAKVVNGVFVKQTIYGDYLKAKLIMSFGIKTQENIFKLKFIFYLFKNLIFYTTLKLKHYCETSQLLHSLKELLLSYYF